MIRTDHLIVAAPRNGFTFFNGVRRKESPDVGCCVLNRLVGVRKIVSDFVFGGFY